jgi:hypothetical protein
MVYLVTRAIRTDRHQITIITYRDSLPGAGETLVGSGLAVDAPETLARLRESHDVPFDAVIRIEDADMDVTDGDEIFERESRSMRIPPIHGTHDFEDKSIAVHRFSDAKRAQKRVSRSFAIINKLRR